jgi:hypothetical protein
MAALYQRASDGRWVARLRTSTGYRYVTGVDREDVIRRAASVEEVNIAPPPLPGDPRFWAKVLVGPNCWLWKAAKVPSGYGQFRVGDHLERAHRVAYEMVVGPIPDGLTIDHLCKNPWCVNPAHLEPVTMLENLSRRGRSGRYREPIAGRAA